MTTARPVRYRLRVRPGDFRVDEDATLAPAADGPYRVYRLEKTGWTTTDALAGIERRHGLPAGAFAYGGRKDRHAITSQLVTTRHRRDLSFEEDRIVLSSVGRSAEPMSPSAIRGNRFVVVLRGLAPADAGAVVANAARLGTAGVPNYFDDQRFRSWDPELGLPATFMLRGDWETALKMVLLRPRTGESRAAVERKSLLADAWWDWKRCLQLARTPTERRVFAFMVRRGANYPAATNLLPRDELSMLLSAWQSWLWNLVAARAVAERAEATCELPGTVAPYVFPIAVRPAEAAVLIGLEIPTVDAKVLRRDPTAAALYASLLDEQGLRPRDLRLDPLRNAFLRSSPRRVLMLPEDLRAVCRADELAGGSDAVELSFGLPRGSYATMVVKAVTLVAT